MRWHERHFVHEQSQWLSRLVLLHRMTESWRRALEAHGIAAPSRLSERDRGFLQAARHDAATVDAWLGAGLPEVELERLEGNLAREQSSLMAGLPAPRVPGLWDALILASVDAGSVACHERWGSPARRAGADDLLRALALSPFSLYPRQGFLVRRSTSAESRVEPVSCAHRDGCRTPAADAECGLHAEWVRGFLMTLDPAVEFSHASGPEGRCQWHWRTP